jgi:hypothetical protein
MGLASRVVWLLPLVCTLACAQLSKPIAHDANVDASGNKYLQRDATDDVKIGGWVESVGGLRMPPTALRLRRKAQGPRPSLNRAGRSRTRCWTARAR